MVYGERCGYLISEEKDLALGPGIRLDNSELLYSRDLLKYKGSDTCGRWYSRYGEQCGDA